MFEHADFSDVLSFPCALPPSAYRQTTGVARPGARKSDWSRVRTSAVFLPCFGIDNAMMWGMIVAIQTTGLTVAKAAERLGVTVGRVRQLLGDGTLVGEKISPRCWLIDSASVAAYAACDRKPGPKPVQKSLRKRVKIS